MTHNNEKEEHRRLKNEFKKREQEKFQENLPMPVTNFLELFDFIDERLQDEPCQHNFELTDGYLKTKGLNLNNVTSWLNENGAYCDCEVLYNIEEQFEQFK